MVEKLFKETIKTELPHTVQIKTTDLMSRVHQGDLLAVIWRREKNTRWTTINIQHLGDVLIIIWRRWNHTTRTIKTKFIKVMSSSCHLKKRHWNNVIYIVDLINNNMRLIQPTLIFRGNMIHGINNNIHISSLWRRQKNTCLKIFIRVLYHHSTIAIYEIHHKTNNLWRNHKTRLLPGGSEFGFN